MNIEIDFERKDFEALVHNGRFALVDGSQFGTDEVVCIDLLTGKQALLDEQYVEFRFDQPELPWDERYTWVYVFDATIDRGQASSTEI